MFDTLPVTSDKPVRNQLPLLKSHGYLSESVLKDLKTFEKNLHKKVMDFMKKSRLHHYGPTGPNAENY